MSVKKVLQGTVSVAAFLLIFESISRISIEVREKGPMLPLSFIKSEHSLRTNELGFRAEIYRNQPERWGVFGTSYLFGYRVEDPSVWSTIVEQRLAKQVHIQNYSFAGSLRSVELTIRNAVARKETFEKVFIVLTLVINEHGPTVPLTEIYDWTGRFFPRASAKGPLVSFQILARYFEPDLARWSGTFRNLTASQNTPQLTNFQDWVDRMLECFPKEFERLNCNSRYNSQVGPDTPLADRWRSYEEQFLPCQREVDMACNVGPRQSGTPEFATRFPDYEKKIETLVDAAKPLSTKIYLIIRAVGTGAQFEPDTLTFDTMPLVIERTNKPRSLDNKSNAIIEKLRNEHIINAAYRFQSLNPSIKIIDLQKAFDKAQATHEHFLDYPHLSAKGNLLAAESILQSLEEEKKRHD